MNQRKIVRFLKNNVLAFVFIFIFLVFTALAPNFITLANLLNILRQISFTGIAAVGMMCVILTGGIDLSIGSLTQVINVLGAILMVNYGISWPAAMGLCMLLALLNGCINGFLIAKGKIPAMIVTISSFNILNGIAYLMSGGRSIFNFPSGFRYIGQGYLFGLPFPAIIMIVIFIAGGFIFSRTYPGKCLYAIGNNYNAARLTGIKVERYIFLSYVISSLLAGLSAILRLSRLQSGTASTGKGFEFEVLTAVVLGGVSVSGGSGKMRGVIFGVLIIGILNNGMTMMNYNTYWQYVINGLVLIVAVAIDIYYGGRDVRMKTV